jgi:hypothetical protein
VSLIFAILLFVLLCKRYIFTRQSTSLVGKETINDKMKGSLGSDQRKEIADEEKQWKDLVKDQTIRVKQQSMEKS